MSHKEQLEKLLEELESGQKSLIHVVLSSPLKKSAELKKATFRPIEDKIQITEFKGDKAFHRNVAVDRLVREFKSLIPAFKQTMIYTDDADYHLLLSKKGEMTLVKKRASKVRQEARHNRRKKRFFEEGTPEPFLIELGVMDVEGRVYSKKQDKFRQVNKFIEIVADTLADLPESGPIRVVDCGCGKAILTFALYRFLDERFGERVAVHGVDRKGDVMEQCRAIATRLSFERLTFSHGSIESYQPETPVSMVVALHACDTATDDALASAVKWNARIILAAPCCQHELASQVDHPDLKPLLKFGILKERFSSLVTDAARATLLEESGYRTQVLEFIDFEHTAKNLMIRAVKSGGSNVSGYAAFSKALSISPKLANMLNL